MNELEPDTFLALGDEIIIQPSSTPTNTPIGEASPTPIPRFTHTPSPEGAQGTPVQFSPATPSPTDEPISEPRFRSHTKNPTLVILAVVISGGTLAAALIISLRKIED